MTWSDSPLHGRSGYCGIRVEKGFVTNIGVSVKDGARELSFSTDFDEKVNDLAKNMAALCSSPTEIGA